MKNLDTINDYLLKIKKKLNELGYGYGLKYFENSGHATVIYDNNQMNTIVYKQLDNLYKYLDELESEIRTIKDKQCSLIEGDIISV